MKSVRDFALQHFHSNYTHFEPNSPGFRAKNMYLAEIWEASVLICYENITGLIFFKEKEK